MEFTQLSWKHFSAIFTFFSPQLMKLKLLQVNYTIGLHIHSHWVGIHVMAKNLIYKGYQNPFKQEVNDWWILTRVAFFKVTKANETSWNCPIWWPFHHCPDWPPHARPFQVLISMFFIDVYNCEQYVHSHFVVRRMLDIIEKPTLHYRPLVKAT